MYVAVFELLGVELFDGRRVTKIMM